MKNILNKAKSCSAILIPAFISLLILNNKILAQDAQPAPKPVKNTFESVWLIDDQTVMVPVKGTFEADIQHRFGTVQNGYQDLFGIYGVSNIRLGFYYAPIKNLYLGFGLAKEGLLWDGSAKYAIMRQTKNKYPVSITYYGNMGYKTVADPSHTLFTYNTERLSFFNEIMIAR